MGRAVAALPAAVIERFKAIDALIHCAGIIQPFVRFNDLDDATVERVFAVNWWGTVYLDRAVLPILLARPEGHIVNVSSMGGFLPVPGQTIYGASKAAVKLFTEGLHSECAGTNVHVTVVLPGAVATNITANSGVDIPVSPEMAEKAGRRTLSAERAATLILDGMEKNAFRVLVGNDAKLMARLYRLHPRRAAGFIQKPILAAEEATVVTREDDSRRLEHLRQRPGCTCGQRLARLCAVGDHDPGRGSAQGRYIRFEVRTRDDVLEEEGIGPIAIIFGRQPEHDRVGCRLHDPVGVEPSLVADHADEPRHPGTEA